MPPTLAKAVRTSRVHTPQSVVAGTRPVRSRALTRPSAALHSHVANACGKAAAASSAVATPKRFMTPPTKRQAAKLLRCECRHSPSGGPACDSAGQCVVEAGSARGRVATAACTARTTSKLTCRRQRRPTARAPRTASVLASSDASGGRQQPIVKVVCCTVNMYSPCRTRGRAARMRTAAVRSVAWSSRPVFAARLGNGSAKCRFLRRG